MAHLHENFFTLAMLRLQSGFNTARPNGAMRKQLDSTRIRKLGWEPKIELSTGLKETYEWLTNSLTKGEEVKI